VSSKAFVRALAFLLSLLALPAPAAADVFRVGDYVLQRGAEAGSFELAASVPEVLASNKPLGLPDGCVEEQRDRIIEATVAHYTISIECEGPVDPDATIVTPWGVDGGAFSSTAGESRVRMPLQAEGGTLSLPLLSLETEARPLPQVATHYTWQGVLHILGGWDHLAFVLCLCLLARGRFLILLVTTFTIGHSISLALAFFDLISIPVPPVEAVIALSIAYMAREALLASRNEEPGAPQRRRQLAVVAGFGLLHGLGFASVLRDLGVATGERVSGLLFFNAGVELGQLIFVAAVVAILRLAEVFQRQVVLRYAALYAAGIIGCFWAIERVAGFSLEMA
jgi:hypothetical protein